MMVCLALQIQPSNISLWMTYLAFPGILALDLFSLFHLDLFSLSYQSFQSSLSPFSLSAFFGFFFLDCKQFVALFLP